MTSQTGRFRRLASLRVVLISLLALAWIPTFGAAQGTATSTFRGRVIDSLGVARAGLLVIAGHPTTNAELDRTITNAEGEFALRTAQTALRIRILSIGNAPADLGVIAIAPGGAVVTLRVELRPIQIPAFVVSREHSSCGEPASGSAAALLLAEARKAILLSTTVRASAPPRATIARFAYWTAPSGRRRGQPTITRSGGASLRPFQSVPRAVLDAEGYVVDAPDGTTFRAPDASLFVDDAFAREYCFKLKTSSDTTQPLIGIDFEPETRTSVVQVAGVLWIDSTTFALSHVDFRYAGLDRVRTDAGAGGTIRFAQLPDGMWFEERWELRMPQLRSSTIIESTRVLGGQVLALHVGDALLYAASDNALVDSLEFAARERVSVPVDSTAPPGAQIRVDTLTAAACEFSPGEATDDEPTTELRGIVIGAPADVGVRVTAEWRDRFRNDGQNQWSWTNRVLETITRPGGQFTLCAVPRNRAITLRAVHEARTAGPTVLRVAPGDRVARVELRLAAPQSTAGQSRIRIVSVDGEPIPYATVTVDGGTPSPVNAEGFVQARTRSRNSVRVTARRIGFVPVDTVVAIDGRDDAVIEMRRIAQSLGAVIVRADPSPLERAGFYDRAERVKRGAFTADLLTPEMLDQRNSARASDHLLLSRFITLEWSKEPRPRRVARGRAGCKMEVLVDGQRPNSDRTEDRNEVPIDDLVSGLEVAAIEVYPSLANAPAELIQLTGGGECGIIAIWTGGRQ